MSREFLLRQILCKIMLDNKPHFDYLVANTNPTPPERNSMKEIPLTQGKVALVDDEDYDRLNCNNWYAHKESNIFYALRKVSTGAGKRKTVQMHREIMGMFYGDGRMVDHSNGDGLDNRKENLRLCTNSQNAMNKKSNTGSSSKYKGVSWKKRDKRYEVYVRANKKIIYVGSSTDETEAARMYDEAAKRFFGEFARLNF